MYSKKLRLADGRSRKLMSVMAAAGAAASVGQNAEAVDFFNSGAITTNNIVGWVNGLPTGTNQVSNYSLNLDTKANGGFSTNASAILQLAKNGAQYFKVATYERPANGGTGALPSAAKTFAANANWAAAGVRFKNTGKLASVTTTNYSQIYGIIDPAKTNKYLLFRFKDNGEVNTYNGWINVDFRNSVNSSQFNGWVKINSYAWQNVTTGILGAGQLAVAVPEPSTLITSGIAALTGGALALRRWRKERKTAPAVA